MVISKLKTCIYISVLASYFSFEATASDGKSKKNKKNIVFIVSEDNGMELGCYGAPVHTPNLDVLADHGVLYNNAYVAQAGSSPSRAAFLTGLYPHQNGQIGLATWNYSMYDEHTPNLINTLKENGYSTGLIGKLHVNPKSAFDIDFHKINSGNFERKNMDKYALYADEFIRNNSNRPFYLQVCFPDAHAPFKRQVNGIPHKPLNPDDVKTIPYIGVTTDSLIHQITDYYNSIMRLDYYVGEIIDVLKRNGKYENTLIVYIGDHGADLVRGKRTCFEGGVRIPMIAYLYGAIHQKYDGLVSTIDIYPTFLDYAGIDVPDYLPGKSLMPTLLGDEKKIRDYLFGEYHVHSNHNPYPQRFVRGKRFKLIHNLVYKYKNPGYEFTYDKRIDGVSFKAALEKADEKVKKAYYMMEQPPEFELYDLKNDPYEFNNLADNPKYKKELNKLKKILSDWQLKTQDPFIDISLAEKLFFDVLDAGIETREKIQYHSYMKPKKNIFK